MGGRLPSVFAVGASGQVIGAGTESTLYTLPPISPSFDGGAILLFGYAQFQIGTAGVSVVMRIRRGTGGTVINQAAAAQQTAGLTVNFNICYVDIPGSVAGVQYVFTVQTIGASNTQPFNDGAFFAMVL